MESVVPTRNYTWYTRIGQFYFQTDSTSIIRSCFFFIMLWSFWSKSAGFSKTKKFCYLFYVFCQFWLQTEFITIFAKCVLMCLYHYYCVQALRPNSPRNLHRRFTGIIFKANETLDKSTPGISGISQLSKFWQYLTSPVTTYLQNWHLWVSIVV